MGQSSQQAAAAQAGQAAGAQPGQPLEKVYDVFLSHKVWGCWARGARVEGLGRLADPPADRHPCCLTGLHPRWRPQRTDAADFCRALYNLLVLRGYSCFLD